jgi:hypothetical protein
MKVDLFSLCNIMDGMQVQANRFITPYPHQTVKIFAEKSDAGNLAL